MQWLEVTHTLADPEALERAERIFDDHFPEGFLVEDPRDALAHIALGEWDAHEFDEGLLAEKKVRLIGYWDVSQAHDQERLRQALADAGLTGPLDVRPLRDEKWEEAWMAAIDVIHIGTRIQIVPDWLEPDEPADVVIRMTPGIGFGSGQHETTRLVLGLLETWLRPGETVFDVGCGSGILAIAARLMGAERVDAMDNDPQAVRAAARNAAENNAAIMVYESDFLEGCVGAADVITANLVTDGVLALIPQLSAHLQPGGRVICSGLHLHRLAEVKEAFVAAGYALPVIEEGEEWAAVVALREES